MDESEPKCGENRVKILASNRFYLPGYQAGGPIISLANIVENLGDNAEFRIVTTDRDINDEVPYAGIDTRVWTPVGKALVYYISRRLLSARRLVSLIKESEADAIYLNSFFDTWFTKRILFARRLGRLGPHRLILAPRGEFSPGALGLKSLQKKLYIRMLSALGMLRGIEWHASTEAEAREIEAVFGKHVRGYIHVATDLGALPDDAIAEEWQPRVEGTPLRICFLSRVSPMKNLLGAIRTIALMKAPARLTVYGPKEDLGYWKECQNAARDLPAHVGLEDGGILTRDEVHSTIARNDVFFLPTLGENYGHVIPEALSVGLPAIISDNTPWHGFAERGIGYSGALVEADFARELDRIAGLEAPALSAMRKRCRDYARSVLTDPEAVEANWRLFIG